MNPITIFNQALNAMTCFNTSKAAGLLLCLLITCVPAAGANGPAITFVTGGGSAFIPDSETGAIQLKAHTTDGDTAVTGVEFQVYQGSSNLVAVLDAQDAGQGSYTADWVPVAPGLYVVRSTATDQAGLSDTAIGTLSVNATPYRSLVDGHPSAIKVQIGGYADPPDVGLDGQPDAQDDFGRSVAMSGQQALVGARLAAENDTKGHAHFLQQEPNSDRWDKIVANLARSNFFNGDLFGHAVAIDGDFAAVSAPHHDITVGTVTHDKAGRVHVYEFDSNTNSWGGFYGIEAPASAMRGDPPALFTYTNRDKHKYGLSLSLQGNTLVVGAPQVGNVAGENEGTVYVHTLNNSGGVADTVAVVPSNPMAGAAFGFAVALDGDTLVVGARTRDLPNFNNVTQAGAVYIFEKQDGTWVEVRRLIAPGPQTGAYFGHSLALDGSKLIVGEPLRDIDITGDSVEEINVGAAYYFERAGDTWANEPAVSAGRIVPDTEPRQADGQYGYAVDIDANVVAVSAITHDKDATTTNTGIVHLYDGAGAGWNHIGVVTSETAEAGDNDPGINDYFGMSLALSDARLLVGVPRDSTQAKPGYAVMVSEVPDPVQMASPASGRSFMAGNAVTLEALAMNPAGGGVTTVEFLFDGVSAPGAGIFGTLDPDTGTYRYTYPTTGPDALMPGIYRVSARTAEGYVSEQVSYYVYAPNDTTSTNIDLDNVDDSKELLYYGTLNRVLSQPEKDAIAAGYDPTVQTDAPQISSVSLPVGGTVAAPLSDAALALTVNTRNTPVGSITVKDRFGNEITSHAGVATSVNGLEVEVLAFNPNDANDPADASSEYLSGITHEYTVILEDPNGIYPDREYSIFFKVDASLPVVAAEPNGGKVTLDSGATYIEVTLSTDDDVAVGAIMYRKDGEGFFAYNAPIQINSSTVLEFFATDIAGNVGPTSTEYYLFGDQLDRVTGFQAAYNPTTKKVDCAWAAWNPQVGDATHRYHIYRAINPADIRRLETSIKEGYPPPNYLRVTNSSNEVIYGTNSFADPDDDKLAPGVTGWYGVTITNAEGNESVLSDLIEVVADPANPSETINVAEATRRATQWLLANQADAGYWGADPNRRIVATAQVLNALGRVEGFTAKHPDVIERGLAYLAGHFQNNNDAIARAVDTLQRYGRDTSGLHARLEFRAYKPSGLIQGWGLQQRYYPDPLHTALGSIARRTAGVAGLSMDDLKATLSNTNLQAMGAPSDRYGWVPQNHDSVYVSALVYRAMDQHHPVRDATPAYNWILTLTPDTGDDLRSFRNNIMDTAAVLIYLPLGESTIPTRSDARAYLVDQQGDDGSWLGDAFHTALCLEAIAERKVLHLRGNASAWHNGSNDAIADLMESRGFTVVSRNIDGSSLFDPSEADGMAMVFVSGDIAIGNDTELGSKLRDLPVPVISCLSGVFPGLALTGSEPLTDYGTTNDFTTQDRRFIGNDRPGHPLVAGRAEALIPIYPDSVARRMAWGVPTDSSAHIASLDDDTTKATIMAYDTNSIMAAGIRAPARRVGLFFMVNAQNPSDDGLAVLHAAIEWATTPVPTP